jgi:hypothetical protein
MTSYLLAPTATQGKALPLVLLRAKALQPVGAVALVVLSMALLKWTRKPTTTLIIMGKAGVAL